MRTFSAVAAKRCLLSLAAIVLLSARLPAQIPATHAGRVLGAWLDAMNGADRAKMKAFLDASLPDFSLDQSMAMSARSGGYDVRKVQESKDRQIAVLIQERGPARQFQVVTLVLKDDNTDRIDDIRLRPTEPPPEFAQPKMTAAELDAARKGEPFKRFSEYVDALNSANRERIQQFVEKSYPSMNANNQLGFAQQTGGFELRAIERATPMSVVGLVQERNSDQFARFTVVVDSTNPIKVVQFNLSAIPRPAAFPIAKMTEAEVVSALKSRLEKDVAADQFAGSIILAKIGTGSSKMLFSGAYGLADRERKIPNTLDTKFRIGSMNKMFTATSILQLVQAGKIKLTDPLGKYVTDYPNKDVAKVTIHQLLTHTGGTGDFFGPEFSAHRLELRTHDDYVKLYGARPLRFEPGSKWEYSNYGMLLLGVVIERVTGQSYYDYVAEHVYKPAGMTHSGSEPEDKPVPDRSIGYMRRSGAWTINENTLPYRGTAAGGGYSTVGDLLKFAEALMGHKLLNAQYTDMLFTGKVDVGNGQMYAYGFEDGRKNGVGAVGHGGGAPGMNGELRIFPQSGYVIAVLANLDPPAASRLNGFIEPRLP